jgi:hypothetical protein
LRRFQRVPDNADLPNPLTLSGFTFQKVVATDQWLANQDGNEIGLQFAPSGIVVELPVPVQKIESIDLRLGVFNAPVHIVATDRLGASKAFDFPHSDWAEHQLDGDRIVFLRLTGGGGEGALGKICVAVFMSGEMDPRSGTA